MKTEFRKALLPGELRSLMAFDRKVFSGADVFDAETWRATEPYWLLVDGVKVGCCAFERNTDVGGRGKKGSLYISTTGILPKYQGLGYGTLLKAWEVAYARRNGFKRILTVTRKKNGAMIRLNRKFGFRRVRSIPRYYNAPVESAVVMELRF
jgi:ribosomal protein S18 acetylase RimI-like enzyme